MSKRLSESLLSELSVFIENRMALHFPRDRWDDLEQNLRSASQELGFIEFTVFCQWLITARLTTKQTEIIASHLTISETYFWREPHVFEALEERILPDLVRARENGEKRLRIWSVGCASGEEPYSLAMAVRRTIPVLKDWNITILATDINPRNLQKAANGVYRDWSFRNSPLWMKEKYFSQLQSGEFEISPEIRNMVKFAYLNLAEDTYPSPANSTNAMDIVFCRNVLMYFTQDRIRQIGEKLFQSLVREGWLMVSASELSMHLFPDFASVNFPDAIVYQKTDKRIQDETALQPVSFSFQLPPQPLLSRPPPQSVFPAVVEDVPVTQKACAESVRILANQGNLSEALINCEKAIFENKLDPHLYFLQATILQEQNRDTEAIVSFKRTLYLDPEFLMGHFALGNLMLQQGKNQIARKHFENALVILANFHQNEILLDSEGLTAGRMREIVSANLRAGALI